MFLGRTIFFFIDLKVKKDREFMSTAVQENPLVLHQDELKKKIVKLCGTLFNIKNALLQIIWEMFRFYTN